MNAGTVSKMTEAVITNKDVAKGILWGLYGVAWTGAFYILVRKGKKGPTREEREQVINVTIGELDKILLASMKKRTELLENCSKIVDNEHDCDWYDKLYFDEQGNWFVA